MAKRMLIDAAHPEETRVVVVSGNRVEEFDFETAAKKQLKGNIYLAKVTRVEPSLQAAFVEYGGNRHGFLAFSEIHPDYYQIPVEDRLALLREEAEEEDDEIEDASEAAASSAGDRQREDEGNADDEDETLEAAREDGAEEGAPAPDRRDGAGERGPFADDPPSDTADDSARALEASGLEPIEIGERVPESHDALEGDAPTADFSPPEGEDGELGERDSAEIIEVAEAKESEAAPESVGAEDAMEELPRRRRRPMRRYKIQEVIKRRQILLVQVVKEERGTKGAALTTYLSLAGRYCVLMPNTDRGGGISRKITSGQDRKRLKDIAVDLEVPEGMGLIIRTAGANRTRPELKRDFEYLLRMWESVRELTLRSTAPALVYEEGNLVKRSIRDLYGRDIDEVLVEGEEAYKEAKAFMKMLTPSHAKNVQQYRDKMPLFQRYQVEPQLDLLYSPRVDLKSGGYIILNATEALVAIDVNSGKSTREHSIEETAHRTNLEAAEEVARQLRLRDLAGLIVIDFIDMEEHRHNRSVERRLKDCLKTDRARIQVGRISAFGLLEMSRQRLRASVLEGSTLVCPHCTGAGRVPSIETQTLRILRAIEEEGIRGRMQGAHVKAPSDVVIYLLNHKRDMLRQIEERFALPCYIEAGEGMRPGQFSIEKDETGLIDWRPAKAAAISPESVFIEAEPEDEPAAEGTEGSEGSEEDAFGGEEPIEIEAPRESARLHSDEERGGRRRRRRRGGRGRERDERPREHDERPRGQQQSHQPAAAGDIAEGDAAPQFADGERRPRDEGEDGRRRRRRGRRGGRRNRRDRGEPSQQAHPAAGADAPQPFESDLREGASTRDEPDAQGSSGSALPLEDTGPERIIVQEPRFEEPARADRAETAPGNGHAEAPRASPEPEPVPEPEPEAEDPNRPRKKGWWQKRLFG